MDRPTTVSVLCIDHLHEFEVADPTIDFSCPHCGCKYVRIVQKNTEAETRVDMSSVYMEKSPPSWLDLLDKEEGG
ncbi:MAG: hypothetical protein QXT45_07715 [Candidatus Bilamarchaeaceae archaeon]